MSPTREPSNFAETAKGLTMSPSVLAPQPSFTSARPWERAKVPAHAPRFKGKSVWKKLMKVLGADENKKEEEEKKHVEAQTELIKDGVGARKKIRTIKTKTIIRNVEFDNKEWEGFPDEVMADGVAPAVAKENSSPILPKKRRHNDKIVSPRKPLRQLNAQLEPIGDDSEEKIAKRKKKEMRRQSRASLLVMDTESSTQQQSPKISSLVNASQSHEVKAPTETRILPPASFMSPARMTSPGKKMRLHMSPARRSSLGEPRRLSGALFADAEPAPLATIDFSTPLKGGSKFRFGADRAVGTPVRTSVAVDAPKTAPAKVQPTRTELEQEMANFFTPIPRDKKAKRRSSPIKSYLQVLLENKNGTAFDSPSRDADSTDTEENETRDEVVQDMELDAPQSSSPTPSPNRDDAAPAEAALGVLPGRFNLGLVPDLKPAGSPSAGYGYADYDESHDESMLEDDVAQKQNVDISVSDDSSSEISEADAADQLRAEFAAVVNTAATVTAEQCEQAIESDTEDEAIDQNENHDELMIDADAELDPEPAVVSSRSPIRSPLAQSFDQAIDEAATDSTDSNQSTDSTSAAPINYEDEETEMLRAFITKSKLAKSTKAASPTKNGSPKSPKRMPLGEIAGIGNASPPSSPSTTRTRKKGTPSTPIKKGVLKIVSTPEPASDATADETTTKTEPVSVRRSGRTPKKSGILPPGTITVRHLGPEAPKKEKTIEQQTTFNTRKNKAGCVQANVVLKRLRSKEVRQQQLKELFELSQKEKVQGKKEVVWKEDLVDVREFEQKDAIFEEEVKAREKAEKDAKKTKNLRIGTASSKVALGMGGNGTPAKRKVKAPTAVVEEKAAATAPPAVEGEAKAETEPEKTATAKPATPKATTPRAKGKQPRLRSPKVKVTIAKSKGKK